MPSLTVVFWDFLDTHITDGVGVDWWRGRGEGKDYGVQIDSHFGIMVFNNQQMQQAVMEAGGSNRGAGGNDENDRINERSVWQGWQG